MTPVTPITDMLQEVQHAGQGKDGLSTPDSWQVQRVRAGLNNALYRAEGGGQAWAIKLCVDDERQPARRLVLAARRRLDEARGDEERGAILGGGIRLTAWARMDYGGVKGEAEGG